MDKPTLYNFVDPIERPLELRELKESLHQGGASYRVVRPGTLLLETERMCEPALRPPLKGVVGLWLDPPYLVVSMLLHSHNCRTALFAWSRREEETISIHPYIFEEARGAGTKAIVDAGLLAPDSIQEFEEDLEDNCVEAIMRHLSKDVVRSVKVFQKGLLEYVEGIPGAIHRQTWREPHIEGDIAHIPFLIIGDDVPHMGAVPSSMRRIPETTSFVGLYGFTDSIGI